MPGMYLGDRKLADTDEGSAEVHRQVDQAFETISELRKLVLKNMAPVDIVDMLEINLDPDDFRDVIVEISGRAS